MNSLARLVVTIITLINIAPSCPGSDGKSELPDPSRPALTADLSAFRVLFVGNSITRHGFNPTTVEKLKWQECTPERLLGFSSTGYYFARELQQKLNIPIGVIAITAGCSSIESWMPAEAFAFHAEDGRPMGAHDSAGTSSFRECRMAKGVS